MAGMAGKRMIAFVATFVIVLAVLLYIVAKVSS
jgi:hypothetical protein